MHIFFNIPCKKIQMNGVRLLHTRVNISVEVKMQDAIEQFRLFFFDSIQSDERILSIQ